MKSRNKTILLISMLVMLICCVSAVSATDADNITVPDDTPVIEIDDAVDSVDEVKIDENDNGDDNPVTTSKAVTVTDTDYSKCFDSNGYLNDTAVTELTFIGNFNAKSFGNFKINKTIPLNVAGATFNDVSFDLLADNLVLDGARFIYNSHGAVVYVNSDNDIVQNLNIVVNTPSTGDSFAILVENSKNVQILGNVITYTASTANQNCYNHVIRVDGGKNVTVSRNNITAYLPLKKVDFDQPYPSIYTDKVAGVAVQSSNEFKFTYNRLLVNVSVTNYDYPTLDALIIVDSNNSYIGHNTIIEIDDETEEGNNNYLYAIDIYQCYDITIDDNNITLESKGGSIIPGTNNGTGTAYGIQLTGGHTGVTISNNYIHTSNNGPNAGIYSQNFMGRTELTITDNTIYVEGNAGEHEWSLVTGMELGDDYAYVEGNTITVVNKAPYESGDNAYGISYSQWTPNVHVYEIYDNTVTVTNGDYAVYLLSADDTNVNNNCLDTTNYCCDNAVIIGSGSNNDVSDNYCTQCSNCPNCSGCH